MDRDAPGHAAAGDRQELRRGGRRIVRRVVGRVAVVFAAGDQDDDRIAAGAFAAPYPRHRRSRRGLRVHQREIDRPIVVADVTETCRNDAGIVADADGQWSRLMSRYSPPASP